MLVRGADELARGCIMRDFIVCETHRRQQVLGDRLGTFLGTLWLWVRRRDTRWLKRMAGLS